MRIQMIRFIAALCTFVLLFSTVQAADPPLHILFLGDNGHHQPAARFAQLQPVLKERGIDLSYTNKLEDLNPATLNKYAGRIIYAKRLLREFGIDLPDTIEFRDAEIDQDGQLILDLRTARVSRRAYSQSPKRQAGKPESKTG